MALYYQGSGNNVEQPGKYPLPPGFPRGPVSPTAPSGAAGVGLPPGIAGYPGLAEEIARINAAGGTNQAMLTALRRRLLIQFGQIPAGLDSVLTGGANADVDQLTRDLAQQATQGGVSTVAQLLRGYNQARNQGVASLAEHGLARSGGTGQVINESFRNYQQAQYGAQQALQDALAQGYQTYLGQQEALRGQSATALKDALQGQIAGVGAGTIATGGAAPTSVLSGRNFGRTLYAAPVAHGTTFHDIPVGDPFRLHTFAKTPAAPALGRGYG